MKITVDTAKCTGHAQCAAHGPDIFELDDNGYAVLFDGEVPAHLEQQARSGAEACPERAIQVVE
jgi:ferredoxin